MDELLAELHALRYMPLAQRARRAELSAAHLRALSSTRGDDGAHPPAFSPTASPAAESARPAEREAQPRTSSAREAHSPFETRAPAPALIDALSERAIRIAARAGALAATGDGAHLPQAAAHAWPSPGREGGARGGASFGALLALVAAGGNGGTDSGVGDARNGGGGGGALSNGWRVDGARGALRLAPVAAHHAKAGERASAADAAELAATRQRARKQLALVSALSQPRHKRGAELKPPPSPPKFVARPAPSVHKLQQPRAARAPELGAAAYAPREPAAMLPPAVTSPPPAAPAEAAPAHVPADAAGTAPASPCLLYTSPSPRD